MFSDSLPAISRGIGVIQMLYAVFTTPFKPKPTAEFKAPTPTSKSPPANMVNILSELKKEAMQESSRGIVIRELKAEEASPDVKFACVITSIPANQEPIKRLIAKLDETPRGRYGYEVFNEFTQQHQVLLADTSHIGMMHRKSLVRYFNCEAYLATTREVLNDELKQFDDISKQDIKELSQRIVRKVLVKQMFGAEFFNNTLVNKMINTISQRIGHAEPTRLKESDNFKTIGHNYNAFSQNLIDSQAEVLLERLKNSHTDNVSHGFLIAVVIEIIKQHNPHLSDAVRFNQYIQQLDIQQFRIYLKDPYIRSLTLALFAGENLTLAILIALSILRDYPTLRDRLRDEIATPYFDSFCHEVMRYTFGKYHDDHAVLRYTERGIKFGNTNIPPRTMIKIDLSSAHMHTQTWQNPEKFYPSRFENNGLRKSLVQFSAGGARGVCPAAQISMAILKEVIKTRVQHPKWGTVSAVNTLSQCGLLRNRVTRQSPSINSNLRQMDRISPS